MGNYKLNYTNNYLKDPDKGKSYDRKINNKFELFIWDLEKYFLKNAIDVFLKGKKDIQYLDFACGTGRVIAFLVNEIGINNAVGLDTSESMLAEARKKTKATFICVNIAENKELLKDKKFDLITIFRLFLNLEKDNREVILKNVSKYLKDDGYIILNNHINRYSFVGLQFWIRRLLGNKKIINSATQEEFREMINNAGLQIKKVYKFTLLPGRNNIILLPWNVLRKAELFISKIPIVRNFCLSQIYVCKKTAQKQKDVFSLKFFSLEYFKDF